MKAISATFIVRRLNILRRLLAHPTLRPLVSERPTAFADFYLWRVHEGMPAAISLMRDLSDLPHPSEGAAIEYLDWISCQIPKLDLHQLSSVAFDEAIEPLLAGLNGRLGVVISLSPELIRVAILLRIYEVAASAIVDGPGQDAKELNDLLNLMEAAADLDRARLLTLHWPVERLLQADPSGDFSRMSEWSQVQYRARVAHIAHRNRCSEMDVVSTAQEAATEQRNHIGFPLFAGSMRDASNAGLQACLIGVATTVVALTIGVVITSVTLSSEALTAGAVLGAILAVQGLGAVAHESLEFFRRRAEASALRARPTFRLASTLESDHLHRTIIAVPTIAVSADDLSSLVARMMQMTHGLPPEKFAVAFLVDPPDCFSEAEALQVNARTSGFHQSFDALTESSALPFACLTRDVRYAPQEARWLAPGRKVEKVRNLFQYIENGAGYDKESKSASDLHGADFVIVVDDDTSFLTEDIVSLVRTALHPLNDPSKFSDEASLVGGIITPFLENNPFPRSGRFCGKGMEPAYDRLGLKVFSGRGLYRVSEYNRVLRTLITTRKVLSHDVLEGAYLGTVLDRYAQFRDDTGISQPKQTLVRERWCRGDFQNLFHLMVGREPFFQRMPLFGKYLIIDNARRAFLPLAQALGVLGFALIGGDRGWLGIVLILATPPACELIADIVNVGGRWMRGELFAPRTDANSDWLHFARSSVRRVVALPGAAEVSLCAFVRAVFRVATERRLLEWTPSRLQAHQRSSPASNLYDLSAPVAFGAAIGVAGWTTGSWATVLLGCLWPATAVGGAVQQLLRLSPNFGGSDEA